MGHGFAFSLAFVVVCAGLPGCGGSGGGEGPDCRSGTCECTENDCTCATSRGCELHCGDECALSCGGEGDCRFFCGSDCEIGCDGSGSCETNIGSGSSVNCNGAGLCRVFCRGDCQVNCPGSGGCIVECTLGNSCELLDCPDTAMTCGNGVEVCGTSCP